MKRHITRIRACCLWDGRDGRLLLNLVGRFVNRRHFLSLLLFRDGQRTSISPRSGGILVSRVPVFLAVSLGQGALVSRSSAA